MLTLLEPSLACFFYCFCSVWTVLDYILENISLVLSFWHFLSSWAEQILYSNLSPHGSLKLYHFIAMVTLVMILLSQFPSFHSLRHINLASLLLSFGYTFLVVGACINAGNLSVSNSRCTNMFHSVSNEGYRAQCLSKFLLYMSSDSQVSYKLYLSLSKFWPLLCILIEFYFSIVSCFDGIYIYPFYVSLVSWTCPMKESMETLVAFA